MTIQFVVESLDGLPEEVAKEYSQGEDKKFYLDVEGAVSADVHKTKVAEFRDKNIELLQEAKKFKDVDPDKYRKMLKRVPELEKLVKDGVSADKVDKLVSDRIAQMKTEYEEKEKGHLTIIDKQSRQLESLVIDTKFSAAAVEKGVRPEAISDVILRAKGVFKVEEGKAVPYEGDNVIYGKDGSKAMSPGEWIEGLRKSAGHLFQPNTGTGAPRYRQTGGVDPSKLSPLAKIQAGMNIKG